MGSVGNISEWEWTRESETNAYSLSYDDLSRITGSRLFRNGTQTGALSENGISYDSNGNILSLTRTGEDGSAVNDLTCHYDGNRLTSLSDGDFQSQNYAYDLDGNMTFDGRTGLSLEWNDLGLVEKVSLNGEDLVNYSYLADGTKVSAIDSEGNGLLYLGSLIYRKTGNSIELESAGFAGGRFVARESSPGVSCIVPMIHVTDHLGSVRAVLDGVSGEVVETNDYFPFGSRWNVAAGLKDETNRFRYNSKEEQSSLYPSSVRSAVSYIDYGARQYDPVLGRWFAQDPLSEKYYGISPYAFCASNPVKYLDPDGEKLYFASNVSEKFKQQFAATVQFMNSKGTSGDLAKLEASETIYYIAEASAIKEMHFTTGHNIISWDPNHLMETTNGIWLSPATSLAHEASHAARYDKIINSNDPQSVQNFKSDIEQDSDKQYDKKEERRVITTVEQEAAIKHGDIDAGQITRSNHKGKQVNGNVAKLKPEEIQRIIYGNNQLLK